VPAWIQLNNVNCNVTNREFGISTSIQSNPGTGDILMDEVDCNGDETSLMDCGHDGWGVSDCDHDEDVSITCVDHLNLTGNVHSTAGR